MIHIATSNSQNNLLNSVSYEGKVVSEWINYFKIDFTDEGGKLYSSFMERSSEAYDLLEKIKPYTQYLESRLERIHAETKTEIIEKLKDDKSKRLPNLEILENLTKNKIGEKYEEYEIAKMILTVFEIIVKKYDTMSYMVNRKYGGT